MDVIAFKGVMFWRVKMAGLSGMDIVVGCVMILLFLGRIRWREINSRVKIWIPY